MYFLQQHYTNNERKCCTIAPIRKHTFVVHTTRNIIWKEGYVVRLLMVQLSQSEADQMRKKNAGYEKLNSYCTRSYIRPWHGKM